MRISNIRGPANLSRSSRSHMLFFLGVPENFAKLTGKQLCRSLFFNKVAGLQPATLLKKRLLRVFFREFGGNFKDNFFIDISRATASACCLESGELLTKNYFLLNVISLTWNNE